MSYSRAIVISKVFSDVEGRSIAATTEHTKTKRTSNLKKSFLMWKIGQKPQPQSILRLRESGSDTTCWVPEWSASIAPTLLSGSVCWRRMNSTIYVNSMYTWIVPIRETKYRNEGTPDLRGKPFKVKGKTTGQTPNNSSLSQSGIQYNYSKNILILGILKN